MSTHKNLAIGDIITIPRDAVAPCLHDNLEGAQVVGFRSSAINGEVAILKTAKPWRAAPSWPENETIGVSVAAIARATGEDK